MLAVAALGGELGEALLEGEPENFHVDVVAELLGDDKEKVPEDEGGEQVDDVGASGEESHACLVNKGEEGDGGEDVELNGAELLEDHVEQADVKCEVHVVRGAVWSR